MDEDREWPQLSGLRPFGPGGSDAARAPLRRDSARVLLFVRRRRHVAVAVTEPARRADFGYLGRGQRPHDCHARPRVLHPRQHWTDPSVRTAVANATSVYLFKPNDAIRSATSATIAYWVKQAPQSLTIEIIDPKGNVAHAFSNRPGAAEGRRRPRGRRRAQGPAQAAGLRRRSGPRSRAAGAPLRARRGRRRVRGTRGGAERGGGQAGPDPAPTAQWA